MTKTEANKLLALMQANYSYAFKHMSQTEKYMLLNSWAFALQDIDANIVMMAAMKLLTVSKWLPTVAEIREKCREMHYEASYAEIDGSFERLSEQERAAYRYIAEHTAHLRGDQKPEISIRAIMKSPQYAALTTGEGEDTEGDA